MTDLTLDKSKKLLGKVRVQRVFSEGKSVVAYPIRVCYCEQMEREENQVDGQPVKVLFSVSKRLFKRAVGRNRLKRLMREAYRMNQHTLLHQCELQGNALDVVFMYISNEEISYVKLEKAMKKAIVKLNKAYAVPAIEHSEQ